jgi:hypothetical protein
LARPNQRSIWFGLDLFFVILRITHLHQGKKNGKLKSKSIYVLSFACAKERTKEKHTGNDLRPLPDALI